MTKLLVTIDVEGFRDGTGYDTVHSLTKLLDELSIRATLFVTPGVVSNKTGVVGDWQRDGHSIGLHLHPSRIKNGSSNLLTTYDQPQIEYFLDIGNEAFETNLNRTTTLFRAGKWEYSETLLKALATKDFDIDASLRPSTYTIPYNRFGVTEVPMTVYDNPVFQPLLKRFDINAIPLHADAFLSTLGLMVPFYGVTFRLLHLVEDYLMISFHDYDVHKPSDRNRIHKYINWLARRTTPTTIESMV